MPDNVILNKMLDRLYASLMRGPSLNCRPHNSRQRVDLTLLDRLEDQPATQTLAALLSESRGTRVDANVAAPPGFMESRFHFLSKGRPAPPPLEDRSDGEADAAPPEPEETPGVRAYLNQKSLLTKLRNLSEDAKTYEQDTGVSVLGVGYPILSLPPGSTGGGTRRILAPVSMIPVSLAVHTGVRAGVEIHCREQGVDLVQPNAALLAWLERETGQTPPDLFTDDDGEKPWEEIAQLITIVTRMLDIAGIDPASLTDPATLTLEPVPKAEGLGDAPKLLPAAVLGLYPVSNQGLLRDMQQMIATPSLEGPVRSFIDSQTALAVEPHETADAEQTDQRIARRFDQERFVARADPCQGHTVRLARQERGLVIHGPPGTGKSQTITNIIGDYLADGKRVLFVCDKRTALDVVYNRLEHLGLSRLCALIHDPQRDQKDLYMSIRARLEELVDLKTAVRAESRVQKIDEELQSIHGELTAVHAALMEGDTQSPSFHEQIGRWLSIAAPEVEGLDDEALRSAAPADLDAHHASIEVVLGRAESIGYADNAWSRCAGLPLDAYLARQPDEMRRQFASCVEDARAADATRDDTIPPFAADRPLEAQVAERDALGEDLAWIADRAEPEVTAAVAAWDAATVKRHAGRVGDMQPHLAHLDAGALDAELWLTVRDDRPSLRETAQQAGQLDAYLDATSSLLGFFKFGTRSQGKKLLRSFGLRATREDAQRLEVFLAGLRARTVLAEVYRELVGGGGKANDLPGDDVLGKTLRTFGRTLSATTQADQIDELSEGWRGALTDVTRRAQLRSGLTRSRARAEALEQLESSMSQLDLFDARWLAQIHAEARGGKRISEAMTQLEAGFDDLETVLRVRAGPRDLPVAFGQAVGLVVGAGVGATDGLAAMRRVVLSGELSRRVAEDNTLRTIDPERLAHHFQRYAELEDQKRELVTDAILHRWTELQKQRLLVGTGSRLNRDGAGLRNRLFVRGKRAMRLRQVIAVGQDAEGGDPLFDMCPVWLASPETVAQVFPRRERFDVVIFDEASQCRLEEALPVLTRGKRVVIAGDPKQLPPTRFFEASVSVSDDNEITREQDVFEAQQSEVEDLLAAALNLEVQENYLDVHYRSRNADLIGFSNRQFYRDRLQPIPGHPKNRTRIPPIQLHRAEGVYEERANIIEAQRVCGLVKDLLKRAEPPSIGIATFNLVQRDLIAEMLDDLATDDADFARPLSKARQRRGEGSFEGLFVKNLENVQGDERDHIIISTTYGPNREGKFYRRFGPLRQAGGGRRLNVLVTRARHEVHLVTSIPRQAYAVAPPIPEGATPNGAWLLFAYLRYAEALAAAYEENSRVLDQPDAEQRADDAPGKAVVHRVPIEPQSLFAEALAHRLASEGNVGSDVHWGNAGFCIDAALHHPVRAEDVTLGLLCDFNRFPHATDPVAWEVFRAGIMRRQGWDLHRIWTPSYFRDPTRNVNQIARDIERALRSESDAAIDGTT